MPFERTWTDGQLRDAMLEAPSWRAVARNLGLSGTSSNTLKCLQRHATRLGLSLAPRKIVSDELLRSAIPDSATWAEVRTKLGLDPRNGSRGLRDQAEALGLETSHLGHMAAPEARPHGLAFDPDNVRRAATTIAAAWFTLHGLAVSWPLEPQAYDLLVMRDGEARKVQVKSGTSRGKHGSWTVGLTRAKYNASTGHHRRPYGEDEVDDFFVIDGDLNLYLLPRSVVSANGRINVGRYSNFQIGSAAALVQQPRDPRGM